MKTVIVYPVPIETPEVRALFDPFVKRFADSLRQFNPGCDYEIAVIHNGEDSDSRHAAEKHFDGLPAKFYCYMGAGADIGSFQHYARLIADENVFMVCCVTRVYAWREGWLKRLVDARDESGPGLYGTSCSNEGGKFHCCCRCYAFDSDDFKRYPHQINSRDQGTFFEVYEGNLWEWFRGQEVPLVPRWPKKMFPLKTLLVTWEGVCQMIPYGYCLEAPNIYRRGDQSNLLVFDKHSDYYRDADETEKRRLEKLCFEGA